MGRGHGYIKLSAMERDFLQTQVQVGTSKSREQNRCRMLLWNDGGKTATDLSILLEMSYATVTQTLKCYREEGLQSALYDAYRSGAPRKVTPELEADVSALACRDCPQGRVRWTLDLLKDEVIRLQVVDTISRGSVNTILKKVNLSLGNQRCGA